MLSPYAHLEFAPQAPQAPINHAVGVTCYTEDKKDPVELAAQWAPLGRVMKRKAGTDELYRTDAFNGTWKQSHIGQRRKLISETVALKTRTGTKLSSNEHLAFTGIARDPRVSTPDRERSPQMSVANRGFLPVALPYLDDAKTLVPGTLAYFSQDIQSKCHGTLAGNKGTPTASSACAKLSMTLDTVGTVLSCGSRQHAMVHLHPLSTRSLKTFQKLVVNSECTGTVFTRVRSALTSGASSKTADEKHILRINLEFAATGSTKKVSGTKDKTSWTKRTGFAATVPTMGAGAPAPPKKPAAAAAAPPKEGPPKSSKSSRRKFAAKK